MVMLLQGVDNGSFFLFFQVEAVHLRDTGGKLPGKEKIIGSQGFLFSHDYGSFHCMPQFPDVPRPMVGHELTTGFQLQLPGWFFVFPAVFIQECLSQQYDVLSPFTQGR